MRIPLISAAAVMAAAILTTSVGSVSAADSNVELTALIASNAQGAFTELAKEFSAAHKGVTFNPQFLGGAQIGSMIDGNTPADVVLAGNTILAKETTLIDTPTDVLRNKELIIVPKGNPAHIKSLKDLANPGVKLSMGTPTSAVGKLASQLVQNAAGEYGFEFVQGLSKNVVVKSEKGSDVVAAVGKEANAAIVFVSDENPAKFDSVQIDDKYNVVSTYTMTTTKNAKNAAMGKEFVAFVASPKGQAVLSKFHYMSAK